MPKWEYYLKSTLFKVLDFMSNFSMSGEELIGTMLFSLLLGVVTFGVMFCAIFFGITTLSDNTIRVPIAVTVAVFLLKKPSALVVQKLYRHWDDWLNKVYRQVTWYQNAKKQKKNTIVDDSPASTDGLYAEDPNSRQQVKKGK